MAPAKKEITPGQTTIAIGVKHVPLEIATKLQLIAGAEQLTLNEVYNTAFAKLIEGYEKKNGKLKVRPKGKGLEGI